MWIARQMAARTGGQDSTAAGHVTSVQDGVTVQADGEYRDLPLYAPPGIAALPALGDAALVMEAGGEKRLVGVRADVTGLEAGEVRLRSAGGAEIVLKNNGQVIINGRAFVTQGG